MGLFDDSSGNKYGIGVRQDVQPLEPPWPTRLVPEAHPAHPSSFALSLAFESQALMSWSEAPQVLHQRRRQTHHALPQGVLTYVLHNIPARFSARRLVDALGTGGQVLCGSLMRCSVASSSGRVVLPSGDVDFVFVPYRQDIANHAV